MVLFLILVLVLIAILILRQKQPKKTNKKIKELNSEWLPQVPTRSYNDKPIAPRKQEPQQVHIDNEEIHTKQQEFAVEERDAYERDFLFDGKEYRIEFELEIDYKDRNGLSTTRQIKVSGYRISSDRKDAEIWGYCYLRGAGRTFYASRIKRCVDLDTGEVITDIIPFLEGKYYSSPIGQLDLWIERRKGEIDILVYVGRLDNQLRQSKKEIIIEYIIQKEPDLTITPEVVNIYLKNCGKVSKTMFGRLLTQLSAAEKETKESLIEVCSRIIETKKSKNMEEEKVIEHMRKRLLPKTK
jgi:hypothetical protein